MGQKCETIKDPFTGIEKTSVTHRVSMGVVFVFKMELEPDGSVIFTLRDAEPKVVDISVPEGAPCQLLLEGGAIIDLALMEESKPANGAISSSVDGNGSGVAYSEWIKKMKITKEQAMTLTQKKVTHLKYKRYDGSEFIFDCKKLKAYKMDKSLMAAAKCMTGMK